MSSIWANHGGKIQTTEGDLTRDVSHLRCIALHSVKHIEFKDHAVLVVRWPPICQLSRDLVALLLS